MVDKVKTLDGEDFTLTEDSIKTMYDMHHSAAFGTRGFANMVDHSLAKYAIHR